MLKKKLDQTYPDSIYYYFDKSERLGGYSFSSELEKSRNAKLVKVRFLYNPTFYGTNKLAVPKKEFYFRLKEDPTFDREQILGLFKKFENKN